ncbi:MAG: hypothetical protein NTZ49_04455 [Candidatus Parcubacteria bacterium]|nr:hypothetical protein [Candidatus Parcubacteria bacterium]
MMQLTAELKAKITLQLSSLNEHFTEKEFCMLYRYLRSLINAGYLQGITSCLYDLAQDLPMSNGILFTISFLYSTPEEAHQNITKAENDFPKLAEFWQTLRLKMTLELYEQQKKTEN